MIHPDECEKVWDTIQAALKEHKTFQITYRIKTADGEQKWVSEQGQGIFTSKGELLAIEGFISEITDADARRAAETNHAESPEESAGNEAPAVVTTSATEI